MTSHEMRKARRHSTTGTGDTNFFADATGRQPQGFMRAITPVIRGQNCRQTEQGTERKAPRKQQKSLIECEGIAVRD